MSRPKRHWYPLAGRPRAAATRVVRREVVRAAKAAPIPIDLPTGPRAAISGRVVTMDDAFTVRNDAVIYIDRGAIVAIQDRARAPPAGFEDVPRIRSGGTLFPGLIETIRGVGYLIPADPDKRDKGA